MCVVCVVIAIEVDGNDVVPCVVSIVCMYDQRVAVLTVGCAVVAEYDDVVLLWCLLLRLLLFMLLLLSLLFVLAVSGVG